MFSSKDRSPDVDPAGDGVDPMAGHPNNGPVFDDLVQSRHPDWTSEQRQTAVTILLTALGSGAMWYHQIIALLLSR